MNIKDWFKLADVDRTLLMKLVALHLIIIAASNYIVQFSGTIFGYHFTWAMFVFPLVVIANEFMAANWLEIATVDLGFKIATSLILFLPVYGILLKYLKSRLAIQTAG